MQCITLTGIGGLYCFHVLKLTKYIVNTLYELIGSTWIPSAAVNIKSTVCFVFVEINAADVLAKFKVETPKFNTCIDNSQWL